jgi:hypothetical protein
MGFIRQLIEILASKLHLHIQAFKNLKKTNSMKLRIIASALLIMLLTVSISNQASARPGYWRGGFFAPRIGVRVGIPVPPVVVGGYYGNGYGYAPAYGPAVVVGGGYYGRGYYNHGYYRGGGYRGGYGPRGYRR